MKKLIDLLYYSGMHFAVNGKKLTIQDADNPDKDEKIVFEFDENDDVIDIFSIQSTVND